MASPLVARSGGLDGALDGAHTGGGLRHAAAGSAAGSAGNRHRGPGDGALDPFDCQEPPASHSRRRDASRAADIQMSSLLSTSLLARVEKTADGRHWLASVATGISTKIQGRDVVITPATQKSLGARLGFLQNMVLKEFHKETLTIRVIGRSANMWLFDTPIVLRFDGENRDSILRYAVLVDSATGRLETLCWPIHMDSRNRYHGLAGPMQWLAHNTIVDCQLYVDSREYTLGIPSKTAFACVRVPQGQVQIKVPPKVGELLARQRPSSDDCHVIHRWLSMAVRQAQAALPRPRPN